MSAKEMFKELGYDYYEDDGFECYKRNIEIQIEPYYISFNRLEREVFLLRKNNNGVTLDTKLLEAIDQQTKELGWNK